MKEKFLALCLVLATLAALTFNYPPENVQAADAATPIVSVPLFTSTVASNATATSTTHLSVDVPPKSLMVLYISAASSGVGTSNVVASFNTSLDGVTWTTTYPYSGTITMNGTNTVVAALTVGTNIAGRFISLDKIASPQTNSITLSSATATFLPAP
jgi:hypothetical protein